MVCVWADGAVVESFVDLVLMGLGTMPSWRRIPTVCDLVALDVAITELLLFAA